MSVDAIILLVLAYAAVKAIFRRLTRPAPYKIQLVSRAPAACENRSTINDVINDSIAAMHDSRGGIFESLEQYRRRTRTPTPEQAPADFTNSHLWI